MRNKAKVIIVTLIAMGLMLMMPAVGGSASTMAKPGKDKVIFIHYKNGAVKPAAPGKGGGKPNYTFLAKGAKWKAFPVDYVINTANEDGLSDSFVTSAVFAGAEEWDVHTGTELFGSYAVDSTGTWDGDVPDGRNEVVFGSYPQQGVIAVTVVWGYFGGPVGTREITEMDILFNNYYSWGDATVDPLKMDLQNIATHEIGHGAGLGDLYTLSAAEETMYGYSTEGETKKRDLNTGDTAGIQALYGQ